jgi:hypothetical protein
VLAFETERSGEGGGDYTVEHGLPAGVRPEGLNVHWRGHAFLFEKKRSPTYGVTGGLREPELDTAGGNYCHTLGDIHLS